MVAGRLMQRRTMTPIPARSGTRRRRKTRSAYSRFEPEAVTASGFGNDTTTSGEPPRLARPKLDSKSDSISAHWAECGDGRRGWPTIGYCMLVETQFRNQQVAGSIQAGGSMFSITYHFDFSQPSSLVPHFCQQIACSCDICRISSSRCLSRRQAPELKIRMLRGAFRQPRGPRKLSQAG
jgi:hypothetical protein